MPCASKRRLRAPTVSGWVSVSCARWLAESTPIIGIGGETVGTDAGAAHSFDPPFPCHSFVLGAGKYGLTQLANLAQLPPTGAVVVVALVAATALLGLLPLVAKGLPRQFWLIQAKRRCSILFHLLVPGGK